MKELFAYRERMLRHWQEAVPALDALVRRIPATRWHAVSPRGGWTCHQVLAHLRDVEAQVIAPSIRVLLSGTGGLLPSCPKDDAWLRMYRAGESPENIFAAYTKLRSDEARWLLDGENPPPWNAVARHPQFGVRTLQWWVEASLQHARRHLRLLQRRVS